MCRKCRYDVERGQAYDCSLIFIQSVGDTQGVLALCFVVIRIEKLVCVYMCLYVIIRTLSVL